MPHSKRSTQGAWCDPTYHRQQEPRRVQVPHRWRKTFHTHPPTHANIRGVQPDDRKLKDCWLGNWQGVAPSNVPRVCLFSRQPTRPQKRGRLAEAMLRLMARKAKAWLATDRVKACVWVCVKLGDENETRKTDTDNNTDRTRQSTNVDSIRL